MFGKTKNPSECLEHLYKTNADETKFLIGQAAKQTNVYGMLLENPNVAEVFIQFFDAAATADVNLGTTVAKFSVGIPAGGKVILDQLRPVHHFVLGCVAAITTTRTGLTAISSDCAVSIYFSQN